METIGLDSLGSMLATAPLHKQLMVAASPAEGEIMGQGPFGLTYFLQGAAALLRPHRRLLPPGWRGCDLASPPPSLPPPSPQAPSPAASAAASPTAR